MRISDQASNHLRVLKAIRRIGPISRSELPGLTGLSGGTITQLTAELVRQGLILEVKETDRRPGRPRTHLEINASAAIVLGVSVQGVGGLETRFVDLLGRPLFVHFSKLQRATSLASYVEAVADGILEAIQRSPFKLADLTRVGLALPGLVSSDRGTLHFITMFDLGPVPAAEIVAARVGLPVTVENDQACMARAIHWFGGTEQLDTFTLIHVGYSVSSARYEDGLPRSGANGLNPEIGHMKTVSAAGARPCFCGGKGCVSAYSSIFGMLAETDLLDGVAFPALTKMDDLFETLLGRADAGDRQANRLLDQAADHLALATASYLTATDPGTVLIAVSSQPFADRLETRFWPRLRESTMPGVLPATEVRFILADPGWRSSGTAALALEQVYLRRT